MSAVSPSCGTAEYSHPEVTCIIATEIACALIELGTILLLPISVTCDIACQLAMMLSGDKQCEQVQLRNQLCHIIATYHIIESSCSYQLITYI